MTYNNCTSEVRALVIYADILVILNLYINYFLVRSTALLLRRDLSSKRCLLAAGIGAAAALSALLPELPFWAVAGIKAAVGFAVVFAAFGKQKKIDFVISLLCFLVISFVFAGLMLALWTFFAPFDMVYSNGVAYFNIPIAGIAVFTAAAYGAVRAVRYFSDRRLSCGRICRVRVTAGEATLEMRGLADTGNGLCDIFSGKAVIVCRRESVESIIPDAVRAYLEGKAVDGIRLLPCKTVAAETLIPIFPAGITIDGKPADGFIGITKNPLGEGIDCIFNPKMISL